MTEVLNLSVGKDVLVPSSLTESGGGYQLNLHLYKAPKTRHLSWLGFQYASTQTDGGDLYSAQEYKSYHLVLGEGRRSVLVRDDSGQEMLSVIQAKNITIGLKTYASPSGASPTGVDDKILELGSDLAAYTLIWKTSDQWGIAIQPHLTLFTGSPFEDSTAEQRALLSIRAGINVGFANLGATPSSPQPGLSDDAVKHHIAVGVHHLMQSYALAKAFSGPVAQTLEDENTDDLLGDGDVSSARLDDIGMILAFNNLGAAASEAMDTQLQLEANESQRRLLVGAKTALTAAAFALSFKDDSATMLTQGFAGGLQLIHGARVLGVGKVNQAKAVELLRSQSLLLHLLFAGAWAAQDEKIGQALLQGDHQAMLANALDPDPAKTGAATASSYHLVYERVKDGGSYFGVQKTMHLPSAQLYTRFRLLGQTAPAPELVQEGLDEVTGRDPLREGAKAKTQSSIGIENQDGPISWSAGIRTTLAFGEGPKPVPGVGLEAQGLLTLGKKSGVELGVGVFAEYLNGGLQYGISPIAGVRF